MIDRDNQSHLVDVCCQDMALFAQVGGLADDIVPPLLYIRNPINTIFLRPPSIVLCPLSLVT